MDAHVNPTGGSMGGPPTLPPQGPSCAFTGYHDHLSGPAAASVTSRFPSDTRTLPMTLPAPRCRDSSVPYRHVCLGLRLSLSLRVLSLAIASMPERCASSRRASPKVARHSMANISTMLDKAQDFNAAMSVFQRSERELCATLRRRYPLSVRGRCWVRG